jgi:hypothetical protein
MPDLDPAILTWPSAALAFQFTFGDLFVAVSVALVLAYRFGWRSALSGTLAGAAMVLALAAVQDNIGPGLTARWLGPLLLLGLGGYLIYQFMAGLSLRDTDQPVPAGDTVGWSRAPSLPNAVLAAWAALAQGPEIAGGWLGASASTGTASASMGLLLGLGILGLLAWACGSTGMFRRIPAYALDGVSACMVAAYGSCFLALAIAAV